MPYPYRPSEKEESPQTPLQRFLNGLLGVFLTMVFISCGVIAIGIAATILVKGTVATWEIIKNLFH